MFLWETGHHHISSAKDRTHPPNGVRSTEIYTLLEKRNAGRNNGEDEKNTGLAEVRLKRSDLNHDHYGPYIPHNEKTKRQ